MNALIQFPQILAMAKQRLRLTNADNDAFLLGLCSEGARNLSTNETLIIKDCQVTVENNKFYLPKDCKQLIAFRAQNSCIPGVLVNVPFFNSCGCNGQSFNSLINVIDINGRWAHLINTVQDGTILEIAYTAVDMDENGMVKINEEAEKAIVMYVAKEYATTYIENYSPMQIQSWNSQYQAQANKVRGLAARRKFNEAKEQIKTKIHQVVNTSSPIGLLSGTYTSFYYPTFNQLP